MRKCVITNNMSVIRTNDELLEMWKQYLEEGFLGAIGNMANIDPTIDSYERRKFFQSNTAYHEKRQVLGLFHQWGIESVDETDGMHDYTVAIVELDDGTIVTPLPTGISFLPPDAERSAYERFARMGHHNIGRGFDVG